MILMVPRPKMVIILLLPITHHLTYLTLYILPLHEPILPDSDLILNDILLDIKCLFILVVVIECFGHCDDLGVEGGWGTEL